MHKLNFACRVVNERGIVYSGTFFKEINTDGSFHVPKDNQHDLLYSMLCPELFVYQRVLDCLFHSH